MKKYAVMVMAVSAVSVGCNQYSYPANRDQPAAMINQDLVASRAAPLTVGKSNVTITDLKCSGADYALTVHYDHGFEEVQFLDIQFQVQPDTVNSTMTFTTPTGMVSADTAAKSGDVTVIVPASKVPQSKSNILARLRLKTPKIVEHTSAADQVYISELCH